LKYSQYLFEADPEFVESVGFTPQTGLSFDLLPAYRNRYGRWIKDEIKSIFIYQKQQGVWLEVTQSLNERGDETAKRVNLDFISETQNELFFPVTLPPNTNATKLIDRLT